MSTRMLPMVDLPPAPRTVEQARPTEALAEFATEDLALPRFHMWTLGCQMNRSDAEQMAGALMAAGCAETPDVEAADLIVINTCAIREAAEQKVIGRQGHLARLKAARPGMRVVLTGCSVLSLIHSLGDPVRVSFLRTPTTNFRPLIVNVRAFLNQAICGSSGLIASSMAMPLTPGVTRCCSVTKLLHRS